MALTFRNGFTAGALLTFVLGIYLIWLWRPAHQVELHSTHLLQKIEKRDWTAIQDAIGQDYGDDWGHNRERLLARLHEVLGFTRDMTIHSIAPRAAADNGSGSWMARIEIEGGDGEVMAEIKQRINSLPTPFELQWRRQSAKPWDWKLTRASNRELKIEHEGY